jgi:hypothetical protein
MASSIALLDIHQTDVRFMHQRRSLQSLAGVLLGHLRSGQFPQLIIDKGKQLLGRLAIA